MIGGQKVHTFQHAGLLKLVYRVVGQCLHCGKAVYNAYGGHSTAFGASDGYALCHACEGHLRPELIFQKWRPDPYEWQPFSLWLADVGQGFADDFLETQMHWLRDAWLYGSSWVEFRLTQAWIDREIWRGLRGY